MAPRVTPAAAAISWSVVRVTPWRAKTLRAAARMPRRVRSDSRFVLRKSKTQHLCHTFVIVYYTRALEPNSQTRDDPRMASVHARPDFRGRYGLLSPSLRSEEHTSELQSHVNLVCRLLLEKKKKKQ